MDPEKRRTMTWQGDALAVVSAGRSVRGVHAMQPGLLGAAHSLINTAAVPTAPSISPASAPGVVGLPTPHSQLSSVGKQAQELAHQNHAAPIHLSGEADSDSIHAGRTQPVEVTRSPGWSPTTGGRAGFAWLAHSEGHPARVGTCRWSLEPTAGTSAPILVCAAAWLVGTSLTWEVVCASSWQEVFLCLNEHLGMSTFLQAGLLFSLPIYFNVSIMCSTTSSRGSGCFTKRHKYYPCMEKQGYSTNDSFEHRFSSPELSLHHARSRRNRRQVWHRNLQEREQQLSRSDYRGELRLV